jgi:carbon monoxide dehydrogenase subunit G
MKKTFLLFTAVIIGITMYAQSNVKTFNVKDFNGITVSGAFSIDLIKSGTESVEVEAENDVFPYIEIKVINKMLVMKVNRDKMPFKMKYNLKQVKAKVTIKEELEWLSISGASDLNTAAVFSPARFQAQVSGASSVTGLNVISGTSKIDVSGASKLTLSGKANEANYDFSGAADVKVNQDVEILSVECSGASRLLLEGKTRNLEIEISGASRGNLNGNGKILEAEISGASKLEALNYRAEEIKIEVSGVSVGRISVEKQLEAEVSGGSTLEYKGSPVIKKIDVSSISSIKKID